ncbi:MAG: hypothetical protein CM1200mP22_16290 [Dehalococcoidia bacterium]|nr:MAG: hypothetical protein CM1200mP22_16290 [Dehalococcoidia bacterium]
MFDMTGTCLLTTSCPMESDNAFGMFDAMGRAWLQALKEISWVVCWVRWKPIICGYWRRSAV